MAVHGLPQHVASRAIASSAAPFSGVERENKPVWLIRLVDTLGGREGIRMQTTGGNTEMLRMGFESTLTDTMLVLAAKSGDNDAFTQLCDRSSKRVLLTILQITKHQEDAEDALQDATLRAFLHLDSFDGRSSFTTWFTRIGINSALMVLRHKKRRSVMSLEELWINEEGESIGEIPDHSPNPEELYAKQEQGQRLWKAIGGLPPNRRSIVEMHFILGHSMRDVALANDISISAAKSRLSRCKPRLRASLGPVMRADPKA
jgi:RNA polymerase sigma-70 factor (ECF subfamily)